MVLKENALICRKSALIYEGVIRNHLSNLLSDGKRGRALYWKKVAVSQIKALSQGSQSSLSFCRNNGQCRGMDIVSNPCIHDKNRGGEKTALFSQLTYFTMRSTSVSQ